MTRPNDDDVRKLRATIEWLSEEHGVDLGDWRDLALVLIAKHYPEGAPNPKKRGRKKKWTRSALFDLYKRVKAENKPHGKQKEAFEAVAKDLNVPDWRTIKRKYRDAQALMKNPPRSLLDFAEGVEIRPLRRTNRIARIAAFRRGSLIDKR